MTFAVNEYGSPKALKTFGSYDPNVGVYKPVWNSGDLPDAGRQVLLEIQTELCGVKSPFIYLFEAVHNV